MVSVEVDLAENSECVIISLVTNGLDFSSLHVTLCLISFQDFTLIKGLPQIVALGRLNPKPVAANCYNGTKCSRNTETRN